MRTDVADARTDRCHAAEGASTATPSTAETLRLLRRQVSPLMFGFWPWRVDFTVEADDLPDTARWTPPVVPEPGVHVCAQCGAETGSDAVSFCCYDHQRAWYDGRRKGAA